MHANHFIAEDLNMIIMHVVSRRHFFKISLAFASIFLENIYAYNYYTISERMGGGLENNTTTFLIALYIVTSCLCITLVTT